MPHAVPKLRQSWTLPANRWSRSPSTYIHPERSRLGGIQAWPNRRSHQQRRSQQPEKLDLAQQRQIFHEVYEVNLFGAAMVTEGFTPLLEKASAGLARIVFVSSHTGSLGLRVDPSGTDSKAALNMITLHYAAKFQGKGWKVNGSCPNLTDTNFTRGWLTGRPASESVVNIVRLATLSVDGESGVYSDENGVVPW
ncbi:uncharacterized protein N7482_005649 [Penicillium canariense]|uniref:Uncharacterized protein n=1 Tax=Penicillium canariense TaxID=189055 RepID=A0A9W9LNM9_9EURO|nr:uncharacterized protein N7482_005649 [Penicillium canariense]KAJ5166868.1 hypothetical protein N7482_005649 [Penicillium canariense]